jgi:CubicO group peptidase (beta-lactamase class C family)
MRFRLVCVWAILALAAPLTTTHLAKAQEQPFDGLTMLVRQKMPEYGVPGVALGILHDGQISTLGLGVTNIDHPLPVTEDTLFQVASISKTFTGTAIMRLVDMRKLDLQATVRSYLPNFRVLDESASREARVITLLTHMAGWEGDLFIDTGEGNDALARAVAEMANVDQIAPINMAYSYNNAGFFVAGRLIEVVTGKPYERALQELVLSPLHLDHTFVDPLKIMAYSFAAGHGGVPGKVSVLRPWALPRATQPAGGVITSVKDLLRYAQFHIGDGTSGNRFRLLSPGNFERMHSTVVTKLGTEDEMAVTWDISNEGGVRQLSKSGTSVGQQAFMTLVPSRRFAMVVLTNSARGSQLTRDVVRLAFKEYLGVTISDPEPIKVPESELLPLSGRYNNKPFSEIVVNVVDGRLMIQSIQKSGYPTSTSPVPQPAPPSAFAFYAKDRLIAIEGPVKSMRAEVIRRPDGSIGWIRYASRLHKRE